MLENMLKWMTDSDTNLTIVCRHRWSRKMMMKVDKYLKLSARTAVFISRRGRLPLPLMKTAVYAQSFKYLSAFIIIFLLQRCLQIIVRLVSLYVIHFNIYYHKEDEILFLLIMPVRGTINISRVKF